MTTRTYRTLTCKCGRQTKRLFYTNEGRRCGDCIRNENLTKTGAPVQKSRATRLADVLSEINVLLDSGEAIDGVGDIEDLLDEMTNWRDGMEGTGLENTGKFEEISECADTLESGKDSLESAIESWNSTVEELANREPECPKCEAEEEDCKEDCGCDTCKEAALEDEKVEVESALSDLEDASFPGMY